MKGNRRLCVWLLLRLSVPYEKDATIGSYSKQRMSLHERMVPDRNGSKRGPPIWHCQCITGFWAVFRGSRLKVTFWRNSGSRLWQSSLVPVLPNTAHRKASTWMKIDTITEVNWITILFLLTFQSKVLYNMIHMYNRQASNFVIFRASQLGLDYITF